MKEKDTKKEQCGDFNKSLKETFQMTMLDSFAPQLIGEMFNGTVLEAVTGLVGGMIPIAGTFVLSYQNKRTNRNMQRWLNELEKNQEKINEKIKKLEEEKKEKLISHYFQLITDYALKSTQEDKIKYIANGYKNLPDQGDFTENFVILYYDVLDMLNLLDLRVLNLCVDGGVKGDNIYKVMEDNHLHQEQIKCIVDKLKRNGLVEDKRYMNIKENFSRITSFSNNADQKGNMLELIDIDSLGTNERTDFGNNFMKFFEIKEA